MLEWTVSQHQDNGIKKTKKTKKTSQWWCNFQLSKRCSNKVVDWMYTFCHVAQLILQSISNFLSFINEVYSNAWAQTIKTHRHFLRFWEQSFSAWLHIRDLSWTNEGKSCLWTVLNSNLETQTNGDMTAPHISYALVKKNLLLSPESRVDADVVRLRQRRCAPPVAQGWRREVLLILGLHLQWVLTRLARRRLRPLMVFLFLALGAMFSSSWLWERGMRLVGLLPRGPCHV